MAHAVNSTPDLADQDQYLARTEESSRVVDGRSVMITRRPPEPRQGVRPAPPCRSGRRRGPARPGVGRPTVLAVEAGIAAAFVVVAAAGVTGLAWLLVAGLAGHGFKDLWQHRRQYVANTRGSPPRTPALATGSSPGHVCRTPTVRMVVVPEAADGQSADVPARYNFLYSSSRPALRAAARGRPRPATTRRSPGTGLTLLTTMEPEQSRPCHVARAGQ